jgi:hemolysin III
MDECSSADKSGAKDIIGYPSHAYDPAELAADRFVHIAGVVLGGVGAIFLVAVAVQKTDGIGLLVTCLYAVCLLAVVGFSAAYNLSPPSRVREILRRLDHATIFFLIAGTYTALSLGHVDIQATRWPAFLAWSVAVAGASVKIAFPRRFELAAVAAYVGLGLIGFFSLVPMFHSLTSEVVILMSLGVALYVGGVIFHLWHGLRFHNAIWHAMVLCAAGCHYLAIVLNLR